MKDDFVLEDPESFEPTQLIFLNTKYQLNKLAAEVRPPNLVLDPYLLHSICLPMSLLCAADLRVRIHRAMRLGHVSRWKLSNWHLGVESLAATRLHSLGGAAALDFFGEVRQGSVRHG
jgi:hypothetical protein